MRKNFTTCTFSGPLRDQPGPGMGEKFTQLMGGPDRGIRVSGKKGAIHGRNPPAGDRAAIPYPGHRHRQACLHRSAPCRGYEGVTGGPPPAIDRGYRMPGRTSRV